MKLYKIEQNVIRQAPYGACDSAIVAAEGPEQARLTHPTDEDAEWDGEYWRKVDGERPLTAWPAPHQVTVTEMGEAAPSVEGVLCASVAFCTILSANARRMHEWVDEAQQEVAALVRAVLPEGMEARVTHDDAHNGWQIDVTSEDLCPSLMGRLTACAGAYVSEQRGKASPGIIVRMALDAVRAVERAVAQVRPLEHGNR